MKIERLEWDSNLFGYEIGKISIESEDDNFDNVLLAKDDFKLVYVESDAPIVKKELGTCYEKIKYFKEVDRDRTSVIIRGDLTVEKYSENLTDQLLSLTYLSGVYSRFRLDENFENNEYKKLYKKWIQNSLTGKIADNVEVVKDDTSKILGFVTIKFENSTAEVGLIAVDNNARGLGLGSLLLNKVNEISINKKCKKIFVSTQKNNKMACKFYEKNGFKEFETKYIYHWWPNK